MSLEDLDYVRQITGLALDDGTDTRRKGKSSGDDGGSGSRSTPAAGITVEQPKKPEYDWFQFFLSCDVAVGLCERYAQVFIKDQMDESVLPDVDASVLRTLGLREGDIIKVMRFLDTKYGRTNKNKRNVSFAGEDANGDAEGGGGGGLFTSGPGQTLRNNTRKGRPAPAVQTSDVVDPKAFSQDGDGQSSAKSQPDGKKVSGFDDDAWDVKPSKQAPAAAAQQQAEPAKQAETPAEPATAPLTAGMKELSLLTAPLEPTKAEPPAAPAVTTAASTAPQAATAPAQPLPGATPAFFQSVAQQQIANGQRQRPTPPQLGQSGILAPPPGRSVSAPQVAPSAFAPPPVLQPQMTGIPQFQTQVAPPGQSLQEINQARLQQQYTAQLQQFQPQIPYQVTGAPPALVAMPTGIQQPPYAVNQFGQQVLNGAPGQFIGPLPPQLTGVPGAFTAPGQPPPGGINSVLPPPLEPQRTAFPPFQQQPTGIGPTFNPGGFAGAVPGPLPQNYPPQQLPPPQFQPQQAPAPAAPLVPQKTGPPPPVRFGVTPEAKKLAPQPTGRRANLAHASEFLSWSWLLTYSALPSPGLTIEQLLKTHLVLIAKHFGRPLHLLLCLYRLPSGVVLASFILSGSRRNIVNFFFSLLLAGYGACISYKQHVTQVLHRGEDMLMRARDTSVNSFFVMTFQGTAFQFIAYIVHTHTYPFTVICPRTSVYYLVAEQ